MIPIRRLPAPAELVAELDDRTAKVRACATDGKQVRRVWSNATAAKQQLRELLEAMAPGIKRCMYCEDSRGTDIDHFQPLAVAPLRAFDWPNHLLACSYCNSNEKRDAYPCDDDGECLLIDPTAQHPADDLQLLLHSGTYEPSSRKGEETVRVFGLNSREDLVTGRRMAYVTCRNLLQRWHACVSGDEGAEAADIAYALRHSPFVDVLRTMERLNDNPRVAQAAFTAPVRAALGAWLTAGREIVSIPQPGPPARVEQLSRPVDW